MKLILSKFSESLLALNHLCKNSIQFFKSFFLQHLRLQFVSKMLVSSANKIDLQFPLTVFDKSFM